jgi:organic radical activating enzyme
MNNLSLYVTKFDYAAHAGAEWPTYEDFLAGHRGDNLSIQQEINQLIDQSKSVGIKFPINTATACQSKWTWSTIWLTQLASSSCHRVNPLPFNIKDFDNFHNLPKKLDDRRLMLEGKWPVGGCEYCRDIENAGGWSDRHHNLNIRGLTPPELENDPTAINVSPKLVEIFAQNTCNLSCTYCNGNLSSKIEQENLKFGNFNKDGVSIPIVKIPTSAAEEYFKKFLEWLNKNITTLKRLHLLGGETFIQHELMNSVLDIIERRPNPELQLCIFSNLNVPDKYWDLYTSRIKDLQSRNHIQYFDLTASIDCWGPEQEYARSGLDLKKFEDRFRWASEEGSWLRLNANQTVTALTMRTMADLIDKIAYYSKHKHIGHYFQFYTGEQMYQHPQTFSYSMWENDFKNIYKAMPTSTVHQLEAIPRMQGMEKQLQLRTEHNYKDIRKLHILLDELDRRRNTNWRLLFPYLDIHE